MSDIVKIKKQLEKIKILIEKERNQDKRTIRNLTNQMKNVDKSIGKLEILTKQIKGGKLRSQKGGGCPYLKDIIGGKYHKKSKKQRK
jgi:hypothetical protein